MNRKSESLTKRKVWGKSVLKEDGGGIGAVRGARVKRKKRRAGWEGKM